MQNSDGGISDFSISGQSLAKGNCHNSRASYDTDMKLRPATKFNKGNKTKSKNFNDDIISENCDVSAVFPIYSQFGAIESWIPDAWSVKFMFPLIVTFYLPKTEDRPKKSLNTALTILALKDIFS